MNTNILSDISRNLLGAWYLDLEFLAELLEEHDIDFDEIMDSVKANFWKDQAYDFNTIVYKIFYKIATDFIAENECLFKNNSSEFEIYTNYMDSRLRFESSEIQEKYEAG